MSPTTLEAPAALPGLHLDELQGLLAALLPALLHERGELLGIKDPASGRYVHVNAAMAAFLRQPLECVLGRTDAELFDATLATALRAADRTAMAHDAALASDHRFDWDGTRREFEVLRLAAGASGTGRRWLLTLWRDRAPERRREQQLRAALEQIEQQQRANDSLRQELADQALRDPLTGLHRRAHFDDQLRREVDLSAREQREFALARLAIDAPTPRMAAFGTAGQHAVLQAMGRLLAAGTRAMDASCRQDSNSFAVLLSGIGLATAYARLEDLRRQCAERIVVHGGQELAFTVSVGLASFPHTEQTQSALERACDGALAEAQRRGGNQLKLAAIPFVCAAD